MKYTHSAKIKILLLALFITLSVGSFFYNRHLIEEMERKERYNVELWAKALRLIGSVEQNKAEAELQYTLAKLDSLQISGVEKRKIEQSVQKIFGILSNQSLSFAFDMVTEAKEFEIPTIQVDSSGAILTRVHITDENLSNEEIIASFINAGNSPIQFEVGLPPNTEIQTVYYKESAIIKLMRAFPYVQLVFFSSLLLFGYVSFSTIRRNEQSNLWVGMAKEAAHQLGTPISSLIGWIELIRQTSDESTRQILSELDQDIDRLKRVADRFNKIGSKPDLKAVSANKVLGNVVSYMEKRLPSLGKQVDLRLNQMVDVDFAANEQLLEWAFENLTKNAIDALKDRKEGYVHYELKKLDQYLQVDVIDNGKGIESKYHKTVFKPGFSTKSRGWGLGLSLTKRIIEEYHGGKIWVLRSKVGEGTTFRIQIPLLKSN